MPVTPVANTTTLAELKARLRALGYSNGIDPDITRLFGATYSEIISERDWRFLETSITVGLPAAAREVALPATYLTVQDVRHGATTLQMASATFIRDLDDATGTPQLWAVFGDRLAVWPAAAAASTLTVDGTFTPKQIMSDVDVPLIPDAFNGVLVWGVARMLSYRHRDASSQQLAEREYATALARLRRAWGPQRSTSVVRTRG